MAARVIIIVIIVLKGPTSRQMRMYGTLAVGV